MSYLNQGKEGSIKITEFKYVKNSWGTNSIIFVLIVCEECLMGEGVEGSEEQCKAEGNYWREGNDFNEV